MGMQAPTTTSSDRSRTNWTPTMERYFIDLLLDQMHRGNRMGHTFNKQAWADMLTMFNGNFGSQYDKDVLKNRYTNLWKQFNDIKNLLDQSGFCWDATRKMVVADECVWDTYIEAHPDAQSYRNKALVNFTELCLIYAYTTADGRYSRSSHDIDFEDDIQGFNIGDGIVSLAPANNKQSKPDWTPAMNQYFIKLMLDQVRKGNKRNETFSKQAWTDMITLFNANFCSQLGKKALGQRCKKLRKHFSDMRVLLEHNGFFWDETQQMIAASDDVWDDYIMAHPHAESYRRKTLPNYRELDVIFGHASTNGIYSHWCQYKDLEDDLLQITNESGGEDGRTPAVNENSRTCWTVPMDRYLIDLLLEQALEGNKIGHAFIPEAWVEMVSKFNARFGSHCDTNALKDRYKHLRRQYNDIKILLEHSGFSYDDTREMVSAEAYAWDSYTKACPEARSYRNKTLPSYHKLCVIFDEESSNGRPDHLARTADLDGKGRDLMFEEDMQCHADGDHLRTVWNPSMDRYLIDIMLEQMLKGNGIGQTFNKQAWINMVTLFKERFGIHNDQDVLRGRHKSLMKLYHEMKNLLDQSGFLWDDTKQMVTAHDDVWDAYIKERPAVKSFRTKTKPNFNDLFILFGKSSSDGVSNQFDIDVKLNGSGRGTRAFNSSSGLSRDWTPPMDRYFIDVMLEQVRNGSMVDNKFNKQAWGDMVARFNAAFGSQHETDVLKIRFENLKKLFEDIKLLLDHSGFVWDDMRQMISGDDDLWDSYIKDHPDARSYRCRPLPNYNDLFLIYGYETTNGMHYPPSQNINVNNGILGVNSGEEDGPSPASCDPLMKDWTKPMVQYFIALMLEQVHRGNTVGHTFSEQAWACIITSFNKKFGLQYDKYILENQYLSLMKEYNDIRNLLNQRGFLWDETFQQVIADDNVWEAYIKEQPDVIKYRGATLGNFNDMSVIWGRGVLDGRLSYMDVEMNVDYNVFDKEMDEIFGILQSPPRDIELPYQKTKRQSASISTSACSRKLQKTCKEVMLEAPGVAADVNTSLSSIKEGNNYGSIETIVAALETIPDLDEELFFDACELLEDEKKVETFMTMDVAMRKKWLLRKLRP